MTNKKQKKINKFIAVSIVVILVATSMTTLFGMLASIM